MEVKTKDPELDDLWKAFPMKSVEETVAGLLVQTDKAAREKEGGGFVKWDGGQ